MLVCLHKQTTKTFLLHNLVHRLYKTIQCYCHIYVVEKRDVLLCCSGQKPHALCSVLLSFPPLLGFKISAEAFFNVGEPQNERVKVFWGQEGVRW